MPTNAEQAQDSRLPSRKIADDLRAAIERGELVPGQKVPSERELARRYGAARNTAREAIRLLSEDGLLLAQHGRGVFVRPAPPLIRFGNDRYSPRHKATGLSPFLMECAKQGKTGRFEVLSIERIVPPPTVADRLQVPSDTASVLRRENVFWADDDPVQRSRPTLRGSWPRARPARRGGRPPLWHPRHLRGPRARHDPHP
jgi:GntR family transcriptional regulator